MRQSVTGEATIIPATSAQLNKLMAELGDLGIAAWIQCGTGLRPSEALAVRLDSFRDGGMVLRVSGQVPAIGRGTAPLKARRPGAYRDVPGTEWLWRKPGDPGRPPVMTPIDTAGRLRRGCGAGEQQGDVVAGAGSQAGEDAVAQVVW